MRIIDNKYENYADVSDIPPGEIFQNEYGTYLKIVPFYNDDNRRNCVDLDTNEVCYAGGRAIILPGAFMVGEK